MSETLKFVLENLKHKKDTLWLEFGVFSGETINFISNFTDDKVYGFDSFEGLPEKWRDGYEKGAFDRKGLLPKVNDNVELIKGWFNDTLPTFLKDKNKKISFIHIDCDLYSSAKTVLDCTKEYFDEECTIVFDEIVGYPGFDGPNGELRALKEFIDNESASFMMKNVHSKGQQMALKFIKHENCILHLTHTWGGGTQKYIDDLCKVFPNEKHVILNKQPFHINIKNTKVLHIHSTMVGEENIGWEVLKIAELFKKENKKVILSVHDYQWLFPWCLHPTTEDFETFSKSYADNFKNLLHFCDKVYFHTENVLKRYKQFCGDINCIVKPPCDTLIRYENHIIQPIHEGIIKVAFLGGNSQHKGFHHFSDLARNCCNKFEFHMYGVDASSKNFISHGKYEDETIIETLHKEGIHVLLALSISEETYCYALTKMINSGLPIVFFNRGSFTDRLLGKHERFFEVDSFCDLKSRLEDAVNYVKNNEPLYDYEPVSNEIISNGDEIYIC